MNRDQLILATLSAAGEGDFSPVQVQKLFFLIDKTVPAETGGPHFKFKPYDYGPFDHAVYAALEDLEQQGLVAIRDRDSRSQRRYSLTGEGVERGRTAMATLPTHVANHLANVVEFVRKASFNNLVSAIYKAYPEMKVNSVFNG